MTTLTPLMVVLMIRAFIFFIIFIILILCARSEIEELISCAVIFINLFLCNHPYRCISDIYLYVLYIRWLFCAEFLDAIFIDLYKPFFRAYPDAVQNGLCGKGLDLIAAFHVKANKWCAFRRIFDGFIF